MLQNYENIWKAFIRPTRQIYSPQDLGPPKLFFKGCSVTRKDIDIKKTNGSIIKCSLFQPFPLTPQIDKSNQEQAQYPCVVYCHGNSGCRIDSIAYIEQFASRGIALFTFDFLGSGISDGEYVSLGYHEQTDLEEVMNYLRKIPQISAIGLFGRSMGAVTALLYARNDSNLKCLVLDSPFSNLKALSLEIAEQKVSLPQFLLEGILSIINNSIYDRAGFRFDQVDPSKVVSQIVIPALFLASNDDKLVKVEHSQKLQQLYKGTSQLKLISGDHNGPRDAECKEFVADFFVQHFGKSEKFELKMKVQTGNFFKQVHNQENHDALVFLQGEKTASLAGWQTNNSNILKQKNTISHYEVKPTGKIDNIQNDNLQNNKRTTYSSTGQLQLKSNSKQSDIQQGLDRVSSASITAAPKQTKIISSGEFQCLNKIKVQNDQNSKFQSFTNNETTHSKGNLNGNRQPRSASETVFHTFIQNNKEIKQIPLNQKDNNSNSSCINLKNTLTKLNPAESQDIPLHLLSKTTFVGATLVQKSHLTKLSPKKDRNSKHKKVQLGLINNQNQQQIESNAVQYDPASTMMSINDEFEEFDGTQLKKDQIQLKEASPQKYMSNLNNSTHPKRLSVNAAKESQEQTQQAVTIMQSQKNIFGSSTQFVQKVEQTCQQGSSLPVDLSKSNHNKNSMAYPVFQSLEEQLEAKPTQQQQQQQQFLKPNSPSSSSSSGQIRNIPSIFFKTCIDYTHPQIECSSQGSFVANSSKSIPIMHNFIQPTLATNTTGERQTNGNILNQQNKMIEDVAQKTTATSTASTINPYSFESQMISKMNSIKNRDTRAETNHVISNQKGGEQEINGNIIQESSGYSSFNDNRDNRVASFQNQSNYSSVQPNSKLMNNSKHTRQLSDVLHYSNSSQNPSTRQQSLNQPYLAALKPVNHDTGYISSNDQHQKPAIDSNFNAKHLKQISPPGNKKTNSLDFNNFNFQSQNISANVQHGQQNQLINDINNQKHISKSFIEMTTGNNNNKHNLDVSSKQQPIKAIDNQLIAPLTATTTIGTDNIYNYYQFQPSSSVKNSNNISVKFQGIQATIDNKTTQTIQDKLTKSQNETSNHNKLEQLFQLKAQTPCFGTAITKQLPEKSNSQLNISPISSEDLQRLSKTHNPSNNHPNIIDNQQQQQQENIMQYSSSSISMQNSNHNNNHKNISTNNYNNPLMLSNNTTRPMNQMTHSSNLPQQNLNTVKINQIFENHKSNNTPNYISENQDNKSKVLTEIKQQRSVVHFTQKDISQQYQQQQYLKYDKLQDQSNQLAASRQQDQAVNLKQPISFNRQSLFPSQHEQNQQIQLDKSQQDRQRNLTIQFPQANQQLLQLYQSNQQSSTFQGTMLPQKEIKQLIPLKQSQPTHRSSQSMQLQVGKHF